VGIHLQGKAKGQVRLLWVNVPELQVQFICRQQRQQHDSITNMHHISTAMVGLWASRQKTGAEKVTVSINVLSTVGKTT
jgi:hypothetical protein